MTPWVLASALILAAPGLKETRKPARPPVGLWMVERIEFNGSVFQAELDQGKSIRIDLDSISLRANGIQWNSEPAAFYTRHGRFEVDIHPNDTKRHRKGIWKIDGDSLIICEASAGKPRPTEFSAPKGSGLAFWKLKRSSKE